MRNCVLYFVISVLALGSSANAAESGTDASGHNKKDEAKVMLGSYTGEYRSRSATPGSRSAELTLVFDRFTGDRVQGTMHIVNVRMDACSGRFPATGEMLDDGRFQIHVDRSGAPL